MCLSLVAAEKTYVVKKNDTLSEIARRYGVSTMTLARLNGLKQPDTIREGQHLTIPSTSRGLTLDPALLKSLDQTHVTPGKWKHLVVHHSATEMGSLKNMDRYHREDRHMENGLAYHFVIGNGHGMADGEIGVGKRWSEQLQGGHLASESLNEISLGICLVGDFDNRPPTKKQVEQLHALLDYLLDRCHLGPQAVKTHQQINPIRTECPGRLFPAAKFIKELKQRH